MQARLLGAVPKLRGIIIYTVSSCISIYVTYNDVYVRRLLRGVDVS